jgi:hypothetical protein
METNTPDHSREDRNTARENTLTFPEPFTLETGPTTAKTARESSSTPTEINTREIFPTT